MIFASFFAALGQLADRRFLKVLLLGVALTIALLFAVYAGAVQLAFFLLPETVALPWVGEVSWVTDLLGWGSLLLMIGLSVFLMVPVAAAFSGLFLEEVVQAVEDRHYPTLPPVRRQGLGDALIASINFFGVLVLVNVVALVLYFFVGPFAPLMFWAVNGYLLGREYFETVAMRRLGRPAARDMRRRHNGRIWLAGALMAAPLSLPFVNLLVPVLGSATFTHLYHRLAALEAGQQRR